MAQDMGENVRKKYDTNKIERVAVVIDKGYIIRTAVESDLPAIEKLLCNNGLTTSGVRENIGNFLVAEDRGVIGVIGSEFAGQGVMLRSMAICSEVRKQGIGTTLVNRSLEIAGGAGTRYAYILTNTAEKFASQFGFCKIQRGEIPNELMQSSALNSFCPSSSSCMKLDL